MAIIRSKKLRSQLAKVDMAKAFSVQFNGNGNGNRNTFCPFHESEESNTKSCSVSKDGLFNCHGCGKHGDVFDFFAKVNNLTRTESVEQLTHTKAPRLTSTSPQNTGGRRVLTPAIMQSCRNTLQRHTTFLNFLKDERGLTQDTIEHFQLGCDERRITIPVFNQSGELINMRRYLPHAQTSPKMVSFSAGYGTPTLFPITTLHSPTPTPTTPTSAPIILCEGEFDAILLQQHGFLPLTTTGGVTCWQSSFTKALAGRHVVIIFDVNDKQADLGQRIAWERARILVNVCASVKIVRLPLPPSYIGGDITDYFVKEHRTAKELQVLIDATPLFAIESTARGGAGGVETTSASASSSPASHRAHNLAESRATQVTLDAASRSEFFYRKITFRCIVAGKGTAPYLPPRHVSIELTNEDGSTNITEKIFDAWDGVALFLIQCSSAKQRALIKSLVGIPPNAQANIVVLDTFNIEEVYLIPAVDHSKDYGPYVLRRCFFIGHGLQTNRVYDFEGYTIPEPATQAATHVLTKATPAETDIDTFQLTPPISKQLTRVFAPSTTTNAVEKKLNHIAFQLADHITHIYGRPDLHIAVDLVFHSPLAFDFDNVRVHKGWLECLILGDTRTGKGFVAEGLCRHYGLGEVVSGENVTLAGLVGSVQHVGDRWTLVWGKMPLADRRLLIIDECGALSHDDISRLSRIRSEGLAEITKVISERTSARTRLIWLGNPRPQGEGNKYLISDYNHGIEAVPELIGAAEDVARFDFALILAHNEVDPRIINERHSPAGNLLYDAKSCSQLIMWAWSRTPSQIKFTAQVTDFVMQCARKLSAMFSPKLALVQGEDVRFKIARIACAAAARTYSTQDGMHLLVTKEHVAFAFNFLHNIYSKRCSGYAQLSEAERERSTLRNPSEVRKVLDNAGDALSDLVDGLLEHRQIAGRDLCDYAGIDIYQARSIISDLVRLRALIKEYTWYVKKPAFKDLLRTIKSELHPDTPLTAYTDEGDN